MKQKTVIGVVALAFLPAVALAGECKPAGEYKVGYISYKARPAEQALEHLLRTTPLKGSFESAGDMSVKARRLRGPLSLSLDRLAEQTGTKWRQDGCTLRFAASASTPAVAQSQALRTETRAVAALAPAAEPVSAARVQAPAPKTVQTWTLHADQPIHRQFAEWARVAGWNFEWKLDKSWLVPAATQFTGTFDDALAKAVEALHAQGKPVRLILWEGNRFAEIVDVDAK